MPGFGQVLEPDVPALALQLLAERSVNLPGVNLPEVPEPELRSAGVPAYTYRPPGHPGQPAFLRSVPNRRGRLWAGGTFFRARQPGAQGNKLSVQVIEYAPPTDDQPDAVCVVTNSNLSYPENVTGPAKVVALKLDLKAGQTIEIDQLHTPTPRARLYSISFKIAPAPPVVTELGTFSFSKLLHIPGLVSAKLTPGQQNFTPADKIVLAPRTRVYRLQRTTIVTPDLGDGTIGTTYVVWDTALLRSQVNENDPWIEMPERAEKLEPGNGVTWPNPNAGDVQDEGPDAVGVTAFAEKSLEGADGLPDNPDNEKTGPYRSIIHINQSEDGAGRMYEQNVVYEWVGQSAQSGSWQSYY